MRAALERPADPMHLAVNAYFWNRPDTGSGQYVRQLVRHLDLLVSDLSITLVWPRPPGDAAPFDDVPPDVRVHAVDTRSGHLGKVWFEQVGFPRACAAVGATVAHVPYWGPPLRSPVPAVVTIHDLITLKFPAYRRRPSARLYTALAAAAARGTNHIITDSEASKREIVTELGVPETAVTAIYLGVDPAFQPATQSLVDMAVLRKYDLPERYVLYLGGYDAHKNVVTLLSAYQYVRRALGDEAPLVLAGRAPAGGDGRGDGRPDYVALVEELGLSDVVRWTGFVDEADKPVVYRNADTFVFPSRYEGFGLPVVEAMASGVPVVASNAGSLPELIGDAGFAVDPDAPREMAGAIIATLVEEELAADLRQRGLARAARFTWGETATATLGVYVAVTAVAGREAS